MYMITNLKSKTTKDEQGLKRWSYEETLSHGRNR